MAKKQTIKPAKGWGWLAHGDHFTGPWVSLNGITDTNPHGVNTDQWKSIQIVVLPASEYRRLVKIERSVKRGK